MISIIGAGPSGCIAAMKGSESDDVVMFCGKDSQRTHQKVQCAGLISKSGLNHLSAFISNTAINSIAKNRIRGAKLYSPSGISVEIDGRKTKAYVFDRSEFDNRLLETAIDSGVEVINKKIGIGNLEDIYKKGAYNTGTEKKDTYNSGTGKIILATGTDYNLHRRIYGKINSGVPVDMPREFLVGAQYEMKIECDPDFVELHFNVPGFFSWIIPVGDYVRVGLCARTNPLPYLEGFVKELGKNGRLISRDILNRNFGIIPVYNPGIKTEFKTEYGTIVTVGDAAGHVKATTGGGIIMGGIAAAFACEKDYESKWRKEIGRELYLHLLIRRFIDRLSDKNMDSFFLLLEENKDIIEKKGDMDIASELLISLARNPRFMAKFLPRIPMYLMDIL